VSEEMRESVYDHQFGEIFAKQAAFIAALLFLFFFVGDL